MIILPHFQGVVTKPSVSTSFDPLTLSPALWLDASDSTKLFNATAGGTTPNDGELVKRWEDKSTNNRHLTEATNAPIRKTSIQNGKDIVRFTGTQKLAHSSSSVWNFLHNGTTHWIFVVVKYGTTSNPDVAYTLLDTHNLGSANIGASIFFEDRTTNPVVANNALRHFISKGIAGDVVCSVIAANVITPNTYILQTTKGDADASPVSGRSTNWINQSLVSTVNTSDKTVSTSNSSFPLTIGKNAGSGDINPLVGDICELIIVPSDITTEQKNNCESYLLTKWAIV